ncbi:fungal-specific transcription factor domain-containing protein [Lentinula aciculospora]|uniref:Fungal-specific transcription factor domain-containing protein n=1 Tax=Lentinula aciculospora TaxID=153920 RepID=A0A9W9ALH8_9AGAR|nr:fungal-specific transcription factor domain-containing protein [Lentinula aciculospora]
MDWHDSDPSEDGDAPESQIASRKRSSREPIFCNLSSFKFKHSCRKTKSKCERVAGEGVPCKSCALAGTTCTFLGPSYKRGPPKGYIHAIEQRWHQVESLLGVILQCTDPRVQGVVADLRQDELACEILNRVDMGPYGPSGRRFRPQGATKEDFFASVLRSNGGPPGRDHSRSRRQSRVSREKVSLTQDRGLSIVPTQEWQENLAARLCSSGPSSSVYVTSASSSEEPATQRRRLDSTPTDSQGHPDWKDMYTLEALSDNEECDGIAEGMGELSLTENQEIRYHGKASGLQFLSKNNRTDDRVEGGLWKLPMARVWPPSKDFAALTVQEDEILVELPPIHTQDHLIDLYFTYIHPVFPVLHKNRFLSEYTARRTRENSPSSVSSPKPESAQKVTNLLLLSIFSIAARFCDDEAPKSPAGQMWEAGCEYLEKARMILTKIFDRSRPSTVQSLLLLGYREFGIGSMEQGWIYIGMAIRMAVDLGLHRNSDSWKHHGHNLFSKDESQSRRLIWWACCLADRYGSVYMGRPIIIRDEDFDVPLPEIEEDDHELWQPLASDSIEIPYSPTPCHIIACQRVTGDLSKFNFFPWVFLNLISIIQKVYPITVTDTTPRRTLLQTFESQLDRWYLNLPNHLRYDVASKRNVPPPHVIFLHIRYWGAVLLLNRALVDFSLRRSTLGLKAFDLAQGAATHLSALVTAWREKFTLKRTSPFLTSYMLSTGIMHLLTLTLRPGNIQASKGLRQCLEALQEMEVLWPSAARAKDLLSGAVGSMFCYSLHTFKLTMRTGVKLGLDACESVGRTKRDADDAFGQEKSIDLVQRETFREGGQEALPQDQVERPPEETGVQDLSQRLMAQMLGLVPGVEPSTSFFPGYEFWPVPRSVQGEAEHVSAPTSQMAQQNVTSYSQILSGINTPGRSNNDNSNAYSGTVTGWMPDGNIMNVSNTVPEYNYPYNYSHYGL